MPKDVYREMAKYDIAKSRTTLTDDDALYEHIKVLEYLVKHYRKKLGVCSNCGRPFKVPMRRGKYVCKSCGNTYKYLHRKLKRINGKIENGKAI